MKRILLVEDDSDFRELLESRLSLLGFEVISASNGKEALQKAKESKPDLIITDIKMPDMDGYSLVKELRMDDELYSVPIIVLTAYRNIEDLFRIEGIEHYVLKTDGADVLLNKISQILGVDIKQQGAVSIEEKKEEETPEVKPEEHLELRRILIVDTDEEFVNDLKPELESLHYKVYTAQDVIQAINISQEVYPDLIISELNIPAGGGFQLYERLKSILKWKTPSIIFVGSHIDLDKEVKAKELGARLILKKPIEIGALVDIIKNL